MSNKNKLTLGLQMAAYRSVLLTAVLLISVLTLNSCQNAVAAEDDNLVSEVYSVDSLAVLDDSQPTLQLRTSSTVPTPCHEFSHIDVEQDGNNVVVRTYSQTNPSAVCIQVLGNMETDMTIDVGEPGTYNFTFVGRSDTLETTITVQ